MIGARIRLPIAAAFAVVLVTSWPAYGAPPTDLWPGLEPGPHRVGLRVHHVYDHSRSFRTGPGDEGIGSRPLQIVVWYPVEPQSALAPMENWEYARLIHTRFDFSRVGKVERQEVFDALLRRAREDGFDPAVVEELLTAKTLAHRDANAAEGRFPLVIYGPGGESHAWDNFVLSEYLASHGYVVAATSSFGGRSARMTYDFDGLEAVTRDHEFVLAFLWDFPMVDRTRVGSMGWSTGAVSAAKFAMRDTRVGAVAALDGSMGYPQNRVAADQSPDYDYEKLNAPFMYMSQRITGSKDLGFLDELKHVDVYLLRFATLTHSDFAAVPILADVHAKGDRAQKDRRSVEKGYAAVCRYVRAFFDARLKEEQAAESFLLREPGENGIEEAVLTIEPRLVSAPRLTRPRFMELIGSGKVDEAIAQHERMRELDRDLVLFDEFELGMEAMRMLRMGRRDAALKILELIAGATRAMSWQLCDALAMARLATGRTQPAISSYARSLELRPDNPVARAAVAAGDELDRLSSPEYLKSFIGDYAGDRWKAAVTLEDDALHFEVPGERKDWLIPVGRNLFLIAGVFGCSVEFVTPDGGGEASLIFHLPSGDVRMTKNRHPS